MRMIKLILLAATAFALMACSLSVNIPELKTGKTSTLEINESASGSEPVKVAIEMGAGSLNLEPGGDVTLQGTVEYNVTEWKPRVVNTGSEIRISQSNTSTVGVPDGQIENSWNLQLGATPMDLSISTGANEGTFDFSGLSITRLSISDGASKTTATFDEVNPVEMEMLEYHTGASEVNLLGLGNAHVKNIEFNGGAGSYELDFTGALSNDINVRISTGMSDLSLIIPPDTHAIVTINGGLSNVNANGTWTISNNTYETTADGPTINITIDMAVGNLNLTQK